MSTRTRRTLALPLVVLALMAGGACSDDDEPTVASAEGGTTTVGEGSGATAGGGEEPDGVAFTDCMRDNGVDMEDPDPATGVPQFEPGVADSAEFEAAMGACESLLPEGGVRGEGDAVDLEQLQAFAECMRDNGLPDFPDPQPGGEGLFGDSGVDRSSPAFQEASEVCGDILAGAEGTTP